MLSLFRLHRLAVIRLGPACCSFVRSAIHRSHQLLPTLTPHSPTRAHLYDVRCAVRQALRCDPEKAAGAQPLKYVALDRRSHSPSFSSCVLGTTLCGATRVSQGFDYSDHHHHRHPVILCQQSAHARSNACARALTRTRKYTIQLSRTWVDGCLTGQETQEARRRTHRQDDCQPWVSHSVVSLLLVHQQRVVRKVNIPRTHAHNRCELTRCHRPSV